MMPIGASIWVESQTGGVGRTVIAANLAFELAAKGRRVCLIDLDERFPALHEYFALPQRQAAVLAAVRFLSQERFNDTKLGELTARLVSKGAALDYLSGFGLADNEIAFDQLEKLLEALCERYDFVVADTSAQASESMRELGRKTALRRLFVVPAETVGLARLAAAATELEEGSLGQLELLLNRASLGVAGGRSAAQLLKAVRDFTSIPVAGVIPSDQLFDEAAARGMPLRQAGQKSKALAAIGDLAERLATTL
jgi:MinD-like ATPase involved in chromosome partitioning or flagellar assembly